MKHFYHLLLALLLTASLFVDSFAQATPPGTVHWKDSLYVDQYEIRNIDYREFLYWYERIHGKESIEYQVLVPKENIWSGQAEKQNYFRHPKFREYPVVGISFEQANAYAKWRSDRVNEDYYIRNKMIEPGDFNKLDSLPEVYTYRLMTIPEWNDLNAVAYKTKEEKVKSTAALGDISPAESGRKNELKIYNLNGNVSEMTSARNHAMGLNWTRGDQIETKKYTKPENWLGFRCICTVHKKE